MSVRVIGSSWLVVAVSALSVQGQGAVLRGRVLVDSTMLPIVGATVQLVQLERTAQTDSLGRFRLANLTSGRHTLLVRRLGFSPFTTDVTIRIADSLEFEIALRPVAQTLAEVVVPTARIAAKLREFHARRHMGFGHFLDSVDISRASGTRLSDKLRALPGLVVSCRFPKCTLTSSRRPPSLRGTGPCPVSIVIDGVRIYDFEVNELEPHAVAAIEWYSGPSQTPPQFNWSGSTCGILMIWTK